MTMKYIFVCQPKAQFKIIAKRDPKLKIIKPGDGLHYPCNKIKIGPIRLVVV